ncbi:hypothetical protein [Candidatus Nucleicultrix amoebiphila]|jgi:hypothetical protein|uniref:DUF4148 domain-containing protein n=1 Tax=Candidatus Nucleicultrix amoebiphila FS5 TaxID=1414854 RepID=A0A1W6N4B1_9PROT|nr:hypothetical protein [Candidatus Nucleicultrix amoebiphila]ARN84727.1 hypothetical protein GQ61_04790 [Candidatus Nucleicultrix amoebiphila FS5]
MIKKYIILYTLIFLITNQPLNASAAQREKEGGQHTILIKDVKLRLEAAKNQGEVALNYDDMKNKNHGYSPRPNGASPRKDLAKQMKRLGIIKTSRTSQSNDPVPLIE